MKATCISICRGHQRDVKFCTSSLVYFPYPPFYFIVVVVVVVVDDDDDDDLSYYLEARG